MECPVCEMGILEEFLDERELKYSICPNCGSEVTTPQQSRYNKAMLAFARTSDKYEEAMKKLDDEIELSIEDMEDINNASNGC